jgi:hypothetical protein
MAKSSEPANARIEFPDSGADEVASIAHESCGSPLIDLLLTPENEEQTQTNKMRGFGNGILLNWMGWAAAVALGTAICWWFIG